MDYHLKEPSASLSPFIRSFWSLNDDSSQSGKEKIIPDGYPELIFHYADPYRVNISGQWELQEKELLAGQIRNHFFLENTGKTGMFGIKMQPTAPRELFDLQMDLLTDKVVPLKGELLQTLSPLKQIACSSAGFEEKVSAAENWFTAYLEQKEIKENPVRTVVSKIIDSQGVISVDDLQEYTSVSMRSLERNFKMAVGLSPKFYIRIIRFSNIFRSVEEDSKWSDIVYQCGYYDQSHFIKNFKEFSGKNPSDYGFDEKTMANFFLSPPKN
ncbi:helix-turn-helix domain-containing protein [Leptobacterium flavescens]|uniref:Helix-turn-helix domain-containing protein n=1 Tax=Leptobacterium flavescens TaxID=472055 RepID=A0A6P0URK1_9FLAO|nr:helix-turn-helix domain-containing protein [Leptobacterium flavescens]NER14409.1 helix-turn-helix domain-containing protein [Leptobacterium flavescens]